MTTELNANNRVHKGSAVGASYGPTLGVGDVSSTAKGSGARYNAGKVDFSLIPLCTLEDEARVWAYGKEKYSKRGDCICNAGNAARKLFEGGEVNAPYVEATMKKNLESEILSTPNDNVQTDASGMQRTLTQLKRLRVDDQQSEGSTLCIENNQSIDAYAQNMGYPKTSTILSSQEDVQSADQPSDHTSTTTMQQEGLGECYAIPATLGLDLSKGLTIGLGEHSPTCGVHQTPGKTGAWNWAKGMDWSIAFASMMRHMGAWQQGQENDPESGLPHLAHAACNLRMLTLFEKTYPEGDDRPKHNLIDTFNK